MYASSAVSGRAAVCRAGPLLALIAAVGACTSAPNPGIALTPPVTATAVPGCPSAGVTLTAGPIDAAMGLRAMRVDLVNCGTEPYTVQGYPAVRVLDDQRRPLGVPVLEGTAAISRIERFEGRPQRVTAAPGGRLAAVVVWRNTVTDASVPAVTGRHLEVVPGGGQPAQTLTPEGGIDLGTTGRLAVSRWITPPSG
jgi:hypothetical protein